MINVPAASTKIPFPVAGDRVESVWSVMVPLPEGLRLLVLVCPEVIVWFGVVMVAAKAQVERDELRTNASKREG
jgi:hypothetical protein